MLAVRHSTGMTNAEPTSQANVDCYCIRHLPISVADVSTTKRINLVRQALYLII
jgi:hypothetical protein